MHTVGKMEESEHLEEQVTCWQYEPEYEQITTSVSARKHDEMEAKTDKEGNPLFTMKGSFRKEWEYVRLVARKGTDMSNVTSADSIKAFCLLCSRDITFSKGNGNSVYRHMNAHHSKEMEELSTTSNKKQKTSNTQPSISWSRKREPNLRPPTPEEQLHGEALLVNWLSESLVTLDIVEDEGFAVFCDFLCRLKRQFTLPSVEKVRGYSKRLARCALEKIKRTLREECNYYSLFTDLWLSPVGCKFMALSITYLTEGFCIKKYVLQLNQVSETRPADYIQASIVDTMNCFELKKEKVPFMLRSNNISAEQACNQMAIRSLGCVGHGLHLVVAPFLFGKSTNLVTAYAYKELMECEDNTEENSVDESTPAGAQNGNGENYEKDAEFQFLDNDLNSMDAVVISVSKTVAKFQALAMNIGNSKKAKSWISQHGNCEEGHRVATTMIAKLRFQRTWNAGLKLLQAMVGIKSTLVAFLNRVTAENGDNEIYSLEFPVISDEEWVFIEGFCCLLSPFQETSSMLSTKINTTYAQALPYLKLLKTYLERSKTDLESSPHKQVAAYFKKYEGLEFIATITSKLKNCCSILLKTFNLYFGVNTDLTWLTFLDPRSRQMKHLSAMDYSKARKNFLEEVLEMALTERQISAPPRSQGTLETYEDDPFNVASVFDTPFGETGVAEHVHVDDTFESQRAYVQTTVMREVELYLDPRSFVPATVDPLVWWNVNRYQFPRIASVARKWLAITCTSSSAARAFSQCEEVLCHRSSDRYIIERVILKKNLPHLQLSVEDLKNILQS